jgi:hypothetical protein
MSRFTKEELNKEHFLQEELVPALVSAIWHHAEVTGKEGAEEICWNFGYVLSLTLALASETIAKTYVPKEYQEEFDTVFRDDTLKMLADPMTKDI